MICNDISSSSDLRNTIEGSQLLQMHFELIPHTTYPSSPLLTTGVIESVNQFARSDCHARPRPRAHPVGPGDHWRVAMFVGVTTVARRGGEGERANLLAMLAYKSSPSERERRPPSHTTPSIAAPAPARGPPTRACQPSLARAHRAPLVAHSPRGPRSPAASD